MSLNFHRSLISHEPEIKKKAELLVHTYGAQMYPDTVGQFWEPFHHNYAYGITKVQVVANILNAMKVGEIGNFALWYDTHQKDTWEDVREGQAFETWFKQIVLWGPNVVFPNIRDVVNQDQVIVRFAEFKMKSMEMILNMSNQYHLITYALSMLTMFFIFGFNTTMNISLWMLLLGIAASEGLSQIMAASGSSIISFEVIGAILMGLWQQKSWSIFGWITFLYNLISFVVPVVMDPPLPSRYFLVGKSVIHAAHFLGTILGIIVVKFVA